MLLASVVSGNYLPVVRVLARSYLDHNPDGQVAVLVVDPPPVGLSRTPEPFEVLALEDLAIEHRELRRMATMYTAHELTTALKPFLLRLLLDRGAASVLFLDADIEVFGPLDDLDAAAREHGLVLTPQRLAPLADGVPPIEALLARSAAYNLGCVGVSPAARPFLDWWAERCRRECVDDTAGGLYVDQRWADLAVTYFPHHVVRDPGCNVAYWNLDRRPVTFVGDGPESGVVAGRVPLRFFRFSGYDPDRPHLLTTFLAAIKAAPPPWILLSEHPELRQLCDGYAARLEAEGRSDYRKLAYGFDTAANGMPIDRTMRRVFRQEVLLREGGRRDDLRDLDELPDPFDPDEVDRFVALLRSPYPASEAPRVPRYLHARYNELPELQRAFPELLGPKGNHFLWWVREMGHDDLGVPRELVPGPEDIDEAEEAPGSAATPETWDQDDTPRPDPVLDQPQSRGVFVVGYLDAEVGLGELGRSMVAALAAIGEPFEIESERDTWSRQQAGGDLDLGANGTDRSTPLDADINLLCVNANRLPYVVDRLHRRLGRDRRHIGFWHWEVEDLPAHDAAAADHLDEVWASSEFCAQVIRRGLAAAGRETPVQVVPHPVIERPVAERSRAELGLPEGFLFLFSFDFFSVYERKNPEGLVEAFCRAFPTPAPPGTGPQLVLKGINGVHRIADLERLRLRVADRPDILVYDGYLDGPEQRALMAACDAYVSLHRSEGFGLTLAEAMLMGKPVVATAYSGNLEFMDEANSFLVGYQMTTVPPGCEPYPVGAGWADPDLDAAAAHLRGIVEDPEGARRVAEQGRQDIRERNALPVVGARIADLLEGHRAVVREAEAAAAAEAARRAAERDEAEAAEAATQEAAEIAALEAALEAERVAREGKQLRALPRRLARSARRRLLARLAYPDPPPPHQPDRHG